MNIFYDHLANVYELHLEFDKWGVPLKNRSELVKLADTAIHHEIFDLIMVEIPEQNRTYFLEIFSDDPSSPAILEFLKEKVPGIENKISKRAESVKGQFINEMRKIS